MTRSLLITADVLKEEAARLRLAKHVLEPSKEEILQAEVTAEELRDKLEVIIKLYYYYFLTF